MDANLVRPAGLQPAAQQRRFRETLQHFVMRDRMAAARDDRHARAAHRMAADGRFDLSLARDAPMYQCKVLPRDAAGLQLAHEIGLCSQGFRYDEQAAGVLVADCVPVLFTNRGGTVVAIAHAGWRGLASGVIEHSVAAIGEPPGELLAYLGPGIGPQAFEVGTEVREAFLATDPADGAAFSPHVPGKWLANLFMLIDRRLRRAGVRHRYGGGTCTYSDRARFFSYRRDRTTGRMAALIWRDEADPE